MLIIDVRTENEYEAGHYPSAINVPLDSIDCDSEHLKGIPKNERILVYCNSGNRSSYAQGVLVNCGFTDVQNGINVKTVENLLAQQ